MNQKFKQPEAAAGKSRELETETFQKNGVSQRNQMRSGNIIQRMFLLFLVLFVSVASLFA